MPRRPLTVNEMDLVEPTGVPNFGKRIIGQSKIKAVSMGRPQHKSAIVVSSMFRADSSFGVKEVPTVSIERLQGTVGRPSM